MRWQLLSVVLAGAVSASIALAQDATRLLPGSYKEKVTTVWRQDERVLEVELTNPGPWLLQELVLEVQFEVIRSPRTFSPPTPSNKASGGLNWEALDRYLDELGAKWTTSTKVEVLPGRKGVGIIELPRDRKVIGLRLMDVRGRELTLLERVKASLP